MESSLRGKRPQGRPKQCFRNVCRKDLRDCKIDVEHWESLADNRDTWKCVVEAGISDFEADHRKDAEEKRQRRKDKATSGSSYPSVAPLSSFSCPYCSYVFKAQTGLYSHLRTHHRSCVDWSSGPLSSFSCPYCRYVFRTQSLLYSHLRTNHRFCADWSSGPSS